MLIRKLKWARARIRFQFGPAQARLIGIRLRRAGWKLMMTDDSRGCAIFYHHLVAVAALKVDNEMANPYLSEKIYISKLLSNRLSFIKERLL